MVGDTENDITAGQNAGCKACAVGSVGIPGVNEYESLLACISDILG